MQFIDLKSQQERIRPELERRINAVLDHGQYIMGPEIRELETRLANYVGTNHCVSCSSGTDGLLMVLLAWAIGHGDAIFTTPFTFIATAEVIALLGATPIFVDIDPQTFNLDSEQLEAAIHRIESGGKLRPRAVISVDLFGLPADYDRINAIASKHGLLVLEDAAQSFGAEYKGRKAGSLAHAAVTSFFPAKPLGCYGDGGAIFTDDAALTETLRSIRMHGKGKHKYDNVRIGINGRLDTMQAAVLLAKLDIFSDELERRQKVAAQYEKHLEGFAPHLITPVMPEGYFSAWAQYSVLVRNREAIQAGLSDLDIPTVIYYPKLLPQQTAFDRLEGQLGGFPVGESVCQRILSLPMHPYLTEVQLQNVVHGVRKIVIEIAAK